jgi:hypothetical protein
VNFRRCGIYSAYPVNKESKGKAIMDSRSFSCWIIIVDGLTSTCSYIGSIIGVPNTTNLETRISALGNTSAAGEKSITVPHQSQYPLKDNSILIGN